jgi:hypothetical protein
MRTRSSSSGEMRGPGPSVGRVEDGRENVAECRPVSLPRSSNRTCLFQASGFPTGFIVNSQTRAHRPLQANHTERAEHPFFGELAGALLGHLVTPSQKVPHWCRYLCPYCGLLSQRCGRSMDRALTNLPQKVYIELVPLANDFETRRRLVKVRRAPVQSGG